MGGGNQLERMIEHLLKLEPSRNPAPRLQWMICATDPRGGIDRRMTATIRREVEPALPDRFHRGPRKSELALLDHS